VEEAGGVEFALQVLVEAQHRRQRRRRRPAPKARRRPRFLGEAPFIGVDRHRLGEVEGVKLRVDGHGDDGLAKSDIGAAQASALTAEQQTRRQTLTRRGGEPRGALPGGEDRQGRFARPRGGG